MRLPIVAFAGLALAVVACSSDKRSTPPGFTPSTGGNAGSRATGGAGGRGSGGKAGSGGSSGRGIGGAAGDDLGGASGAEEGGAENGGTSSGVGGNGASDAGGMPSGGGAGVAIAGRGEEPEPCAETQEDPPAAPGACEPGASWGAGESVAVMADAGDPLIAITPDELTLLFMHVTSVGEARIADRASVDDDFDEPVPVNVEGVVGLSPDGLRVIARAFDGTLQEAARPAVGEAFGAPSEGDFSLLNAAAATDGLTLTSPVIAPDDRTLYYLAVPPDGAEYPLHVSTRAGSGAWPVGMAVQACELKSFEGFNPVPTGVSSDGLTLFFWDSFYGTARAGFREQPGGAFVWFDDLGVLVAAQPNAACDRVYYSADGILYATSR
jgi:hypothetical protein